MFTCIIFVTENQDESIEKFCTPNPKCTQPCLQRWSANLHTHTSSAPENFYRFVNLLDHAKFCNPRNQLSFIFPQTCGHITTKVYSSPKVTDHAAK